MGIEMEIQERELRSRLAEALLNCAALTDASGNAFVSARFFALALQVENGYPIVVDSAISGLVCVISQDMAGVGHYDEAVRLLERGRVFRP